MAGKARLEALPHDDSESIYQGPWRGTVQQYLGRHLPFTAILFQFTVELGLMEVNSLQLCQVYAHFFHTT